MAEFQKSGFRKLKDFQSLLASHRGEILKKSIYGEASFHRRRVSTEDGFPISNVGNVAFALMHGGQTYDVTKVCQAA